MTPLYLSSSFLTSSANLEPVEYNSDDRRVNNPSVCACRHSRNRPQARHQASQRRWHIRDEDRPLVASFGDVSRSASCSRPILATVQGSPEIDIPLYYPVLSLQS